MSMIPIATDGSLEPHICICVNCGNDTGELSIGVLYKADYKNKVVYADRNSRGRTNKQVGYNLEWSHVKEGEKVTTGFCDDCKTNLKEMADMVRAGGVFFKCEECQQEGAIQARHPLSAEVRKQLGIAAPDPCGIKFVSCAEHGRESPVKH